jgi:hypothetical protein
MNYMLVQSFLLSFGRNSVRSAHQVKVRAGPFKVPHDEPLGSLAIGPKLTGNGLTLPLARRHQTQVRGMVADYTAK